jgi:hydroxymethylpyrimidine/phosphomethylpyrimidine kinase
VDVLVGPAEVHRWRAPRTPGRTAHGTGCTLSSLIAGALAKGENVPEATARAIGQVRRGIAHAWAPMKTGWAFLGPLG